MQPQKFDVSKNHGIVYNHEFAQYEQNGMLYDAAGNPCDKPDESKAAPGNAIDFLRDILDGGEMMQANIKKESELQGLNWQDVQNAALELSITKTKVGNANLWKLAGDN